MGVSVLSLVSAQITLSHDANEISKMRYAMVDTQITELTRVDIPSLKTPSSNRSSNLNDKAEM